MLEKRLKTIRFIFLLCLILITIRLFTIQTVTGKQYSVAAALQQTRNRVIYRERGDILDRNGIRFTGRKTSWQAILQPETLLTSPSMLRTVAELLQTETADLTEILSKDNLPVIGDITSAQAMAAMDLTLPGLSVMDYRVRNDEETLASHILGYVDEKGETGLAGLEKSFQDTLYSGAGVFAGVIADAGDSFMRDFGYRIWNNMGREKLNIKLTLDYHMQSIVEETMDRMVDKGAVVLADILTGEIRAIASRPDFDPSNIKPYLDDPDKPLFNRALGAYTPGSIFKIVTAAAALEAGISPDVSYDCPGYVDFDGVRMKCWSYEQGGHGTLNMAQAFAQSCNSYFIKLGLEVGRDAILEMAEEFGFGHRTGLYSQGIEEPTGRVPSTIGPGYPAETGNISIGQGELLVSPIQAVNMTAAIANGGILNRLSLVDSVVNEKGERIRNISTPSWKRVISKETAASLQGMMLLTVQSGTGELANVRGYGGSAGKTGSAETGWIENDRAILHAWFSGYFPVDNPKYALCVFIEDGKSGAGSAAPVFAEIAAKLMDAGY
ncbi:MAG: stage V sporulation protein D [Clostridiaceae bacterium]|nr:stage V sporulation protein D [Clostridiaceae bacterium]